MFETIFGWEKGPGVLERLRRSGSLWVFGDPIPVFPKLTEPNIGYTPTKFGFLQNSGANWLRAFDLSNIGAIGLVIPKRVTAEQLAGGGFHFGVCVLINDEWVLTAHHVLDSAEFARNYHVVFDFMWNGSSKLDTKLAFDSSHKVTFDTGTGLNFLSSEDLSLADKVFTRNHDWAAIRLETSQTNRAKMKFQLLDSNTLAANAPKALVPFFSSLLTNEAIAPLHFVAPAPPLRNDGDLDRGRVLRRTSEDYLEHKVNISGGASGAPLLSTQGGILGIHVAEENIGPNLATCADVITTKLLDNKITIEFLSPL
jgi:Trypsin-like peptidase domain